MISKASVTLASSASAKLRELQAQAKSAAESELAVFVEQAARVASEAADLGSIDIYSKARRESLSRIANFLAGEMALLQPMKSASTTEVKVAA